MFPDDLSLANYFLFDRLREGKGDKVALRFGDRSWTYQQVADRSRALARALVEGGMTPEQRVYVVLPDTPAFAWSILASIPPATPWKLWTGWSTISPRVRMKSD